MAIDPADTSDFQLPDDLQFISEQLAEDADHLARTFPANAPHNWRRAFAAALVQRTDPARPKGRGIRVAPSNKHPAIFSAIVAAAAVTIIAVGWYTVELRAPSDATQSPVTARQAPGESRQPSRVITAGAGLLPSLDLLRRPSPTAGPTVVVPVGAATFDHLSGAEQEAVIDMLNQRQIPEANVPY